MDDNYCQLENDCLALVAWCYKNQGKRQTYRIFEEATGIPLSTLDQIIKGFKYYGKSHWALESYAKKYGFDVTYVGEENEILFVQKIEYGVDWE